MTIRLIKLVSKTSPNWINVRIPMPNPKSRANGTLNSRRRSIMEPPIREARVSCPIV
jgi:hypothetical protein